MRKLKSALLLTLIAACTAEAPSLSGDAMSGIGEEPRPDSVWLIRSRTLPAPAAASPALRASIEATPQPDLAEALLGWPKTPDEWAQFIDPIQTARSEAALKLAEGWPGEIVEDEVGGVVVRMLTPEDIDPANANRLFVHLHGGAYVFNGGAGGITEGLLIAERARIPTLSVDYRMPPDHPFPAALDDVVAVWTELLTARPATSMAMGGTSAGGGLTLAATHRFKELGLELPGALWAGTPWADLTTTGDSRYTNEGIDRTLVTFEGLLTGAAELYAAGRDLRSPLISPVYGDFTGFPPTYLVTGTRDLFLSDVARVHRKMRIARVRSDLNVYEGVSHADYAFVSDSPESEQVFGELGAFLLEHLR